MTSGSISVVQRLRWILNILFHQALAVIFVYILSSVFNRGDLDSLSTWHMVLTPLGVLLLMMESLILFMDDNIYTIYMPRNRKHYIHTVLQVTSTISITVGIAFRINTKNGNHFNSTHGILGLIAWILIWCSLIGGILTSQSKALKNYIRPVWIKTMHICVGLSGFTIGLVALGFGMNDYLKNDLNENTVLAAIIVMAVLYVWAVADACLSLFNQIRSILGK